MQWIHQFSRQFSTTTCLMEIRQMAKMKIVDNSKIGRNAMKAGSPVKVIHVYNKKGIGGLGDRVMVVMEHEKRKAVIVGCKQNQRPMVPKFDSNNIVLIDEQGQPLGTRIRTPVPSCLRSSNNADFVKVLSIATKFV